jgi:AhpD family alkylhydroperoxidase
MKVKVMEAKTKLLIAIGAAVVANCQPCLKTLLKNAQELKIEEKELLEAIGVAKLVRKNSTTQIDRFLSNLTGNADITDVAEGCGCK